MRDGDYREIVARASHNLSTFFQQKLNRCSGMFLEECCGEIRENSQYATKREDCGALLCSQQTASELWKHRYLLMVIEKLTSARIGLLSHTNKYVRWI